MRRAAEPNDPARSRERFRDYLALLARLPVDQRQAVELHHRQGGSLTDLAGPLGQSKGVAAQLLFRGLRRLRELLPEGKEGAW